jgi:nitrogen fixation/metabolism regulation signal transduction histidine kinase
MDFKTLKRFFYTTLIVTAVALGISALVLLGQTVQNSEQFGRTHDVLLMINAAAAGVLLLLIFGNLIRLWRDFRRRIPGVKLKARMLASIIGLAVAPIVVVYLFSVQFLNRGIDAWFDVEIESGLEDALTLGRSALDRRIQINMERTQRIAGQLIESDGTDLVAKLGTLRREAGAAEVTLFGRNFFVVATSAQDLATPFPTTPPEDVILQLRQARSFVGIYPIGGGRYQIRSALILPRAGLGGETLTLQALYPVEERVGSLVDSVEKTVSRYKELNFLRDPLKYSFALTLTLVVMLSILASVYAAFFFARRLAAPILSVVAGTHAVAQGDFDSRLPNATHDEIGFLIDSFNEMIQRLGAAREEARISEQRAEKERAHVEAILARLSTGVVAVEGDGRIRIANDAASAILNVDLDAHIGERLETLAADHRTLNDFMVAVQPYLESDETEWRQQIVVQGDSGRRILICACTGLPAKDDQTEGKVVVFDDVTALIQAQRDAAWGEVARRLAHEIKNPLTPIQLSAERIRRRYLGSMKDVEAEVLDRATHTIVAQVEAMRDMVNAFSDYARAPEISISRFQLNRLIQEVAYLYRPTNNEIVVELDLDENLPEVEADNQWIRQLLHNLIRNAMEAMEGQDDARLDISTRRVGDSGGDYAQISVSDNGPGIDSDTLDHLFEPYVTTKAKGTGLGLAIVKKLIEEHGGTVVAENLENRGACISVRLPLPEAEKDGNTDGRSGHSTARRERA